MWRSPSSVSFRYSSSRYWSWCHGERGGGGGGGGTAPASFWPEALAPRLTQSGAPTHAADVCRDGLRAALHIRLSGASFACGKEWVMILPQSSPVLYWPSHVHCGAAQLPLEVLVLRFAAGYGLLLPSMACCTMRFGSTAKALAKCKLKYCRISECAGCHLWSHMWAPLVPPVLRVQSSHSARIATLHYITSLIWPICTSTFVQYCSRNMYVVRALPP